MRTQQRGYITVVDGKRQPEKHLWITIRTVRQDTGIRGAKVKPGSLHIPHRKGKGAGVKVASWVRDKPGLPVSTWQEQGTPTRSADHAQRINPTSIARHWQGVVDNRPTGKRVIVHRHISRTGNCWGHIIPEGEVKPTGIGIAGGIGPYQINAQDACPPGENNSRRRELDQAGILCAIVRDTSLRSIIAQDCLTIIVQDRNLVAASAYDRRKGVRHPYHK